MNQMVTKNNNKDKKSNSSNSLVFGRWPQTKMTKLVVEAPLVGQVICIIKMTNFNESGCEGGDVAVATDVLAVERESVVHHGHDQPREEDVDGSLPHLRGLNQHDQLLEDFVNLLLLGLG